MFPQCFLQDRADFAGGGAETVERGTGGLRVQRVGCQAEEHRAQQQLRPFRKVRPALEKLAVRATPGKRVHRDDRRTPFPRPVVRHEVDEPRRRFAVEKETCEEFAVSHLGREGNRAPGAGENLEPAAALGLVERFVQLFPGDPLVRPGSALPENVLGKPTVARCSFTALCTASSYLCSGVPGRNRVAHQSLTISRPSVARTGLATRSPGSSM